MLNSAYNRLKTRVEYYRLGKKLKIVNPSIYSLEQLEQLFILKAEIPTIDLLLDLGANKGKFTKCLSEGYELKQAVCIEPNSALNKNDIK